jgi:hypothetical protein
LWQHRSSSDFNSGTRLLSGKSDLLRDFHAIAPLDSTEQRQLRFDHAT